MMGFKVRVHNITSRIVFFFPGKKHGTCTNIYKGGVDKVRVGDSLQR